LTFAGYLMGLIRDRIFAHTFGAGPELDAYNAAFILPELALDVLVAGGLIAPFVPIFVGLRSEAAEAAAAFGRTILTLAIVVMAIAAGLLFIFAPQTVDLIAPGFQPDQQAMYVELFRIMCITPVIFAASLVLGEILVSERSFVAYGLAPLMYNAGIVGGTLVLGPRYGVFGAAVGAVIGALGHLAVRAIGIWRVRFRPRPSLALRTKGVGEFLRLMLPKMISHPVEPLMFLYFTALASTLEPGSVTSLSFAHNFQSVPVSLIGASFAIAAFPVLSASAAAGDRPAFVRQFRTTLITITLLTTVAAIGLFLVSEVAIRVLLGGGAFDDADVARTSGILAVFALSIPLESVIQLVSRAIYATHNTIVPTAASIAGFIATVIVADLLVAPIGVAAIPAAFAAGLAVELMIMAVGLVPRMARIGTRPPAARRISLIARPDIWPPAAVRPRLGRAVAIALGVVLLGAGAAYATDLTLTSGATIAVDPLVTPWARPDALIPSSQPTADPGTVLPSASSPSGRPGSSLGPGAGPAGSPAVSPAPSASPSATPGPFAMDLYRKGDYVGELKDTWCVPAAMQTSMNIMNTAADTSQRTQARIFALARSIAPAPDGAAEPEAWATGLRELGYGNYQVTQKATVAEAIHVAARQVRLTNRPAGLMVWRGAHSWVMSGFTATADPAVSPNFTVIAVRIEDVWYPRLSSIWGYSRPPDSLVPVAALARDYLPWKRPTGAYPAKDGQFVLVIPTS
ncbi:MAG TPA: lipid II flippase MurJ, partial [Candidatus Limnocylindrales bacterium]